MKAEKTIEKITLVRLSAIGDAVLMLPVVRALQHTYPNANLTWVIGQAAHSLMAGLDGVHFVVLPKPKSWRQLRFCYQQLGLQQPDVLLAAQASWSANVLYPMIKAPRKIGFDRRRARDGHRLFVNETIAAKQQHLLDGFMQFATSLGARNDCVQWDLPIAPADHDFARNQLRSSDKTVAINLTASKLERNWPLSRYVQLIGEMQSSWQCQVLLVGGGSAIERARAQQLLAQLPNCRDMVGKTTLKQLAAVLAAADVLISPDSGPVHIATAMGTPVIGLYAVASSRLCGPYRASQWVVDQYAQAVQQFLRRDPESVNWAKTRVHDARAMELISVPAVLEKLHRIFVVE